MANTLRKRSGKLGMSPGALVFVGHPKAQPPTLRLTEYSREGMEEKPVDFGSLPAPFSPPAGVRWLDVCGLHDVALLGKLGELLDLHPLVLEDIANTHQRPKVEFHDDYLFAVVRMACRDGDGSGRCRELRQVSFVLGKGYLVTFREEEGPVFDHVRGRLQTGAGRLRKEGPDYLMYALLDLLVDHYFVSVESLSDRTELLEAELLAAPTQLTLAKVHNLRAEAALLRRASWPLREVVQGLYRSESPLLTPMLEPFLRDLSDHVTQVAEMLEMERETLSGYMDLYVSISGNRLNKTMALLTIIATIFIPLTFIVGVYGMNFDYMPELKWRYGYFLVWGVMGLCAAGMLYWFRRNRWI